MKLLFLAGSSRKQSVNKKLAKLAHEISTQNGHNADFIDLHDYPMPIYNGDHEAEHSLPEAAIALKNIFTASDGIFIASPEYNSSITPLLCNSLNWISRPHQQQEKPMQAFRGKIFALASASPGGFGGVRGLLSLRILLNNVGGIVLPDQFCLPMAFEQFADSGNLKDEKYRNMLNGLLAEMASFTARK